jgi:hypothetical protein
MHQPTPQHFSFTRSGPARQASAAENKWRIRLAATGERGLVEKFIFDAYLRAYGARLTQFMPQLAAVTYGDELMAACGLRDAARESLFLETYLDEPVEHCIVRVAGEPVARNQVVEVGNLAIARPGAARMLIALLTRHLLKRHVQWCVFTAVPALRNNFLRLRIPLNALGHAASERLDPAARRQWGRYYDASPEVLAVRVAAAAAALAMHP